MIRFTSHAEENLNVREIEREAVIDAVLSPELIAPDATHLARKVYMKRYFDRALQVEMLCRVVVEETGGVKTVVTVYKTSQIKRYFKSKRDNDDENQV